MFICSEPNTIVIEGLKCDTSGIATVCYKDLAYALGHHYVGLMYRDKICHWIEAAEVEPAVKYYLNIIMQTQGN